MFFNFLPVYTSLPTHAEQGTHLARHQELNYLIRQKAMTHCTFVLQSAMKIDRKGKTLYFHKQIFTKKYLRKTIFLLKSYKLTNFIPVFS